MNSPSGCITALFAVVLLVVLAAACVGTVYLFQADSVSAAITDIAGSISSALEQIGKAVLYFSIGGMGALLLVGLGYSIKNAGPGIDSAGEGIAKAAIGTAVAKAIEEGKAAELPPVWEIFAPPAYRAELPEARVYESQYLLEKPNDG